MKIGVFDSGLGGLLITKSLVEALPDYDYIYLGDTARVPYGNRSQQTIYEFSQQAVDYLFGQECELIIIACNTASAEALRRLQTERLPWYPGRNILGVIIPTVEEATKTVASKIGVLATASTVKSGAYVREIKKLNRTIEVFQQAAPLLVPLIENDGLRWVEPILRTYLTPLLDQKVDKIILGCTHYPALRQQVRELAGSSIEVICQDEVLPQKLADYLIRHPEIDSQLSKSSSRQYLVTDLTENTTAFAQWLFKAPIALEQIGYLG